jgi:uncharacterized protein
VPGHRGHGGVTSGRTSSGPRPATRPLDTAGSRWWLGAFAFLFTAYQLPQVLVQLGVARPAASLAMFAVYPLALVLARRGRMRFSVAYGLRVHGRRWIWLPTLFAAAVVAKAAAVAFGVLVGIYTSDGPAARMPTADGWTWLGLATFVPSLAEDILTRGLWRHSPLAGDAVRFVLGTATVYTLNHVWRLTLGPAEWLMLFCFGAAYAGSFWSTGTLWAAVGLHWGWNFAGQAVDGVWNVAVTDAAAAKLLSAAVHLGIGAVVMAAAPRPLGGPEPAC